MRCVDRSRIKRQKQSMRNHIFTIIGLVLVFNLTSCNIGDVPESMMTVNGENMLPSYPPGTSFGIDESAYVSRLPQRGDIVVYNHPKYGLPGLGRVVGLPNERIEVKQGLVFIDGIKLNEPYIDTLPTDDDDESIQLGADEFFVILDNRNDLYADRVVITSDLLVGKAVATCRAGLVVQCEEIEAVNYGYD